MKLVANDIAKMLKATGATGGQCASNSVIANGFNDAINKYGGGHFNTKEKIAALLSESLMESAYFRTTVEYSNTGPYQPYRGRTWIQITWKSNYAAFGEWCHSHKLLSDPNEFVNHPVNLGRIEWAALGPVWYFLTHKLYNFNGDITKVARAVNLGDPNSHATPNGMRARAEAYDAVMSVDLDITPVKAKTPTKKKAKTYKVKEGDTLSSIAYAHHLTLAKLEKLNPQIKHPNVIHIGDKITIG